MKSDWLQTPPRYVTVQDIRHTLRRQYGRFWGRKIRILLITGTASEVELLTPGLTEQFWQEEQGTLLLWGGEPRSRKTQIGWLRYAVCVTGLLMALSG